MTAFASIMVFLVALMMFQTPSTHHGVGPDLPRVDHPIPMPDANREDAMLVAIMRDGTVFFGNEVDLVPSAQGPARVRRRRLFTETAHQRSGFARDDRKSASLSILL